MTTIREEISAENLPYIELLETEYPGKRILFFDIETTGFTPDRAIVYLIGLSYRLPNGNWEICQLFNDDGMSEPAVLRDFYTLLPDFDLLMNFNGDRFDIPFLEGRLRLLPPAQQNSLSFRHLTDMPSADLLKLIRPLKSSLGMPNVKQKTVERYLGIDRIDQMDGGQLISVYWDYITTDRRRERELLLQHNRDDMEGMLLLSGIFGIRQLFHPDEPAGVSVTETKSGLQLHIHTKLRLPLPHPIDTVSRLSSLSAKGTEAKLTVPIRTEPLYYFYGQKNDGFEERSGFFIPLLASEKQGAESLPRPLGNLQHFRESFSKKQRFISLSDNFLRRNDAILAYAGLAAEYTLTHV